MQYSFQKKFFATPKFINEQHMSQVKILFLAVFFLDFVALI